MVNAKVLSLCNDELRHTNHKCIAEHYMQGDMGVLHISIRKNNEVCYEFHGTFVPAGAVDAMVKMACDAFIAGTKTVNASAEYVKTANRWLGLSL